MAGPPDMDLVGQDGRSQHESDLKRGNPNRPSRHHTDTTEKKQIIYFSLSKTFR